MMKKLYTSKNCTHQSTSKRFKIMKKLYRPTLKAFLKIADGRMRTPHLICTRPWP